MHACAQPTADRHCTQTKDEARKKKKSDPLSTVSVAVVVVLDAVVGIVAGIIVVLDAQRRSEKFFSTPFFSTPFCLFFSDGRAVAAVATAKASHRKKKENRVAQRDGPRPPASSPTPTP
ncbi:hypothetical protein [Pandoravirus japonicus]|uniref:Uncharacterized protein n=1 Tax=Pandoravirus japonicus TaxID=2823154 RepID=A0A811BQ19_9VIRU|nr:hypothetical protein [Pandoravirus japonicus]